MTNFGYKPNQEPYVMMLEAVADSISTDGTELVDSEAVGRIEAVSNSLIAERGFSKDEVTELIFEAIDGARAINREANRLKPEDFNAKGQQ